MAISGWCRAVEVYLGAHAFVSCAVAHLRLFLHNTPWDGMIWWGGVCMFAAQGMGQLRMHSCWMLLERCVFRHMQATHLAAAVRSPTCCCPTAGRWLLPRFLLLSGRVGAVYNRGVAQFLFSCHMSYVVLLYLTTTVKQKQCSRPVGEVFDVYLCTALACGSVVKHVCDTLHVLPTRWPILRLSTCLRMECCWPGSTQPRRMLARGEGSACHVLVRHQVWSHLV